MPRKRRGSATGIPDIQSNRQCIGYIKRAAPELQFRDGKIKTIHPYYRGYEREMQDGQD